MVFRQVIHADLGCASYLVGDEQAGVAAVVDPKLAVDDYLELAGYLGVRIEHVLETHEHADHISGHGRLAVATGATIHVHEQALAEYEHEPFADGWELELGRVRLTAMHTPGHRPEHCAFVLTDMDLKVSSTVGYERMHQPLLRLPENEFVHQVLAGLGPQPPNFAGIVAANRGRRPHPGADVRALTPLVVRRHAEKHSLVVDVRTEVEFDEAHVPAAVSITALRAGFGTKLAWLVDSSQPVVLVGRGDGDARAAAALAAAAGVIGPIGYLTGGMTDWRRRGLEVATTTRLTLDELHERWDADAGAQQVLDVRERDEWEAGHVPGSRNIPFHDLRAAPPELDARLPVAVVCASGHRAAVGASLLQRHGVSDVVHVVGGGVPLWSARGWPIEGRAGLES